MKIPTSLIVPVLMLLALPVGLHSQAPQDAPKEHSMTGCLRAGTETGTFQLTDLEKGPKTVEIAETTAKLAPHVGHKVEITGSVIAGKDPKAHTMKVTAVKMLSPTCP
jgi:hypothetical protein